MPTNTTPPFGTNGYPLARDLTPVFVPLSELKPLGEETRKHPPKQILKLAGCLQEFGFVLPIVVDAEKRIVAGRALVEAARKLELLEIPAVVVADLSEAKLRMLRLALNRLSEDSNWDSAALKIEFQSVLEISSDVELTSSGFEAGEVDVFLSESADEEDELPVPASNAPPRAKPGDLFKLGEHKILCGDALKAESYARLMGAETADFVFTDPPWNIPIAGNVSGLGKVKHADFAMACGEMKGPEFVAFLSTSLGLAAGRSRDGALHFLCMHWSKLKETLAAADGLYGELVNLCVWNKTNAGMGSLYRSKHELIFVFKVGKGPHVNNVALGRYGRHRTNVWDYPGATAFNGTAKSKLGLHPTVKPVALVADAIKDASNRGDLVLDPFGGAGTTLIAAEKCGRRARLIELDPAYVDATIFRWETLSGRRAEKIAEAPQPEGETAASSPPSAPKRSELADSTLNSSPSTEAGHD